MEWIRKHDHMNQTEKLVFKRIINQLLAKTFLLRDAYDLTEGRVKVHADFRFVERFFDVFSGYLDLAGFVLHRDNAYGVMSLASTHDYNKFQFNKFTTLVLLSLRLMFEERREEVSLRHEVIIETHELVSKMQVLGIIEKKPSMKDLADALKILASFNIVERFEKGKWEAPETRLMILPSILFIIPNEKISQVAETIGLDDQDQNEDMTADDDADLMEDMS